MYIHFSDGHIVQSKVDRTSWLIIEHHQYRLALPVRIATLSLITQTNHPKYPKTEIIAMGSKGA